MAPTKREQDALNLYATLMEEAKMRLEAIESAVRDRTGLSGPIVQELCYLQLRMLCELVALACLVAHGDVVAAHARSLQKTYEPHKILAQLDALHPDFYPQAVRQTVIGRAHHFEPTHTGITKTELLRLHAKSGDFLHRGKLKNIVFPVRLKRHFPEVMKHAHKIHDLLKTHTVALHGGKKTFVCLLRNADDDNNVQLVMVETRPT
jgi:hypothetical protein